MTFFQWDEANLSFWWTDVNLVFETETPSKLDDFSGWKEASVLTMKLDLETKCDRLAASFFS